MDIALLIVYLLIALLFSFLCSVFEAVLLSIRRPYVATQETENPKNAAAWRRMLNDVNRPLSAILILNTVAHTVGAAGVGAQATKVFGDGGLTMGIVSAVLTLLILLLSEIIPKTLGAVYWKKLAPLVGVLLSWLTVAMSPLVWITEKITSGMSHGEKKGVYSRAEFIAMADIGTKEGALEKSEGRIVKNLFGLKETTVSNAMTPSTVVFALPGDSTVSDFVEKHADRPFSRIPIYSENLDDLDGFVLRAEIFQTQLNGEANAKLSQFKRSLLSVPQTQTIAELFETMIAESIHIAAALDEFGALAGIITLEDVIETLIGVEIVDEVDHVEDMQEMARDLWKKRAERMGIELEEATGTKDEGEADSTTDKTSPAS